MAGESRPVWSARKRQDCWKVATAALSVDNAAVLVYINQQHNLEVDGRSWSQKSKVWAINQLEDEKPKSHDTHFTHT